MTPATNAANILLESRRSGRPIAGLPVNLEPKTRDEAYLIQDGLIAGLSPVGCWKIMGVDGGDRFCSPLPASFLHPDGATIPSGALPIVIAEIEVAVRFGRDLPHRKANYTADDIEAAVGSIHPAIELISLSWTRKDAVPSLTQLADFQNSAGLVVGPARTNWFDLETGSMSVTLLLDGKVALATNTGPSLPKILDGLAWLANHAAARGVPLLAGHVVTTGARVMAPTSGARSIEGKVEGLGRVTALLDL